MISWTMILCLKIAALGLVGMCEEGPNGGATQFLTEYAPDHAMLVQCPDKKCREGIKNLEKHGFIVTHLAKHDAELILPEFLYQYHQDVLGQIILAAQTFDRRG